MNIFEPQLSRRMAKIVQNMPPEVKYRFVDAVELASSEEQILEPYRSYLKNGYKPDKVTPILRQE